MNGVRVASQVFAVDKAIVMRAVGFEAFVGSWVMVYHVFTMLC
jgi:hypothetical protein